MLNANRLAKYKQAVRLAQWQVGKDYVENSHTDTLLLCLSLQPGMLPRN